MGQVIIRRRLVQREKPIPSVDTDDLVPPDKVMRPVGTPQVQPPLRVRPPVKEVEPVEEPEVVSTPSPETVKIQPVNMVALKDILMSVMQALGDGKAIIIMRLNADRWQISPIADMKAPLSMQKKLTGKAYWDEVLDEKYVEWDKEWASLTQAERIQRCKKAGVKWDEDKDIRINNLRMTEAYRTILGVEKYKPEYRDRASRAAIKG